MLKQLYAYKEARLESEEPNLPFELDDKSFFLKFVQ